MRRSGLSRGGVVLLLVLAFAALLAVRAAANGVLDPGDLPGERSGGAAPPDKLHPTIAEWLARRPSAERERVVVTFQPGAAPPEAELTARHGGRVLERFWINNALLVELPIGALAAVAARPDVTYVQPEEGGEPPPR